MREQYPEQHEHQSGDHQRRLRRWLAEDDQDARRRDAHREDTRGDRRDAQHEWHPADDESRQRDGEGRDWGHAGANQTPYYPYPGPGQGDRRDGHATAGGLRSEDDWRRRERARQQEQERRAHDWRDELGLGDFSFGRHGRNDGRNPDHWPEREHRQADHGYASPERRDTGSAPRGPTPHRADEMLHLDWERSARLRGDYGDYGHVQDDRYRELSSAGGTGSNESAGPHWSQRSQRSGEGTLSRGRHGAWTHEGSADAWQRDSGQRGSAAPGRQGGSRHLRPPRGYVRSDERIREDLCERLMTDPYVDATDVSIAVHAGVVHLEGSVAERNMRYALESVAASCIGVKDVENHVRVQGGTVAAGHPDAQAARHALGQDGTPSDRAPANAGHAGNAGKGALPGNHRDPQDIRQDHTSSPSSRDAGLTNTSVSDTHGLGGNTASDPSRFIRTHTD